MLRPFHLEKPPIFLETIIEPLKPSDLSDFRMVPCKASAEPIGRLRLMTSTVQTTKRHLLRCVPTSSTDHIIQMQQGQGNEIQILEIKPLVFLRPFEPFKGHNYYTNDAKFPAIPLHSTPIGTHIKALW